MRSKKTYCGELMEYGKKNEEIVLRWLKKHSKSVLDFREFRLAQRIDVDFGVESIDGNIVLVEIKSDKWISEEGNMFFESNRINHYVVDKWFYLGWGWRSPAQKLLIRNPNTGESFMFNFLELRKKIGLIIKNLGRNLKTVTIETDDQKTTFGYLIKMEGLDYQKYTII